MDLDITTVEDMDPVIVSLAGELDIASAPHLEDRIRSLIDGGRTRLVIELAELIFCDSTGIGILVRANNDCVAQGGHLRLAAPSRHVARVLAVVGLLDAFPTYQSVDAASARRAGALVVAAS
jgi:anti-sigma B factor antagonist